MPKPSRAAPLARSRDPPSLPEPCQPLTGSTIAARTHAPAAPMPSPGSTQFPEASLARHCVRRLQ
jgi:hypothetical protein